MQIAKLSLKEIMKRHKMENVLSDINPEYNFLYRGHVYDVNYFYDTFILHFWKAIEDKAMEAKIGLREIPIYGGDVIIYGVTNANTFTDFMVEYFIRFIYNIRTKERCYVWDMYMMCYPQNISEKLYKHFENNFVFYKYEILSPYIRFYVPKSDKDMIDIILKNVIAKVLVYVIGVSENEFRKKNSIIKR